MEQSTKQVGGFKKQQQPLQNGAMEAGKETKHNQQHQKSDGQKTCKYCAEFFSRYQCAKSFYLECDCPKCMGYCECGEDT